MYPLFIGKEEVACVTIVAVLRTQRQQVAQSKQGTYLQDFGCTCPHGVVTDNLAEVIGPRDI